MNKEQFQKWKLSNPDKYVSWRDNIKKSNTGNLKLIGKKRPDVIARNTINNPMSNRQTVQKRLVTWKNSIENIYM